MLHTGGSGVGQAINEPDYYKCKMGTDYNKGLPTLTSFFALANLVVYEVMRLPAPLHQQIHARYLIDGIHLNIPIPLTCWRSPCQIVRRGSWGGQQPGCRGWCPSYRSYRWCRCVAAAAPHVCSRSWSRLAGLAHSTDTGCLANSCSCWGQDIYWINLVLNQKVT